MTGISRTTFQPIDNLESALQGVNEILATPLRSRVIRRQFGGGIIELLGRRMTPSLFPVFLQLLASSIDRWEPRFRVRKMRIAASAEDVRSGQASIHIFADYRPRAHLSPPDFSVERTLQLALDRRGLRIMSE